MEFRNVSFDWHASAGRVSGCNFLRLIVFAIAIPVLSNHSFAQIKYSREEKDAAGAGFSFSQTERNGSEREIRGGEIHYSKQGRIGFSVAAARSFPDHRTAVGLMVEAALYRPFPAAGIGINLLGGTFLTWEKKSPGDYSSPSSIQTGSFGLEIYYRSVMVGVEVEPFLQFVRSSYNAEIYAGKLSVSSVRGGADIIIPVSEGYLFVLSGAATGTSSFQSSIDLDFRFFFTLN